MTLKELIDKLPAELQQPIRDELKNCLNIPIEAAQRIIMFYQSGDLVAAHAEAVNNMTGAELYATMQETNARMKAAGIRVGNEKAQRKAFVEWLTQMILNLAVVFLQSKIEI